METITELAEVQAVKLQPVLDSQVMCGNCLANSGFHYEGIGPDRKFVCDNGGLPCVCQQCQDFNAMVAVGLSELI